MLLDTASPLLAGLRFLAFGDNTARLLNTAPRGGGAGTVTAGTLTRLGAGFPAVQGNGSSAVVTFDTYPQYAAGNGSRDITVLCRCRADTAHIGGVVCSRSGGTTAGWQILWSNAGAFEDGYNFAVFSSGGKFMEAQDGLGSSAQTGKDVVVVGQYSHAAREVYCYTRQPGNAVALFRNTRTNTNSSNVATEDWDVRSTAAVLWHNLNALSFYFNGSVAWAAVFNRLLNRGEIEAWSRDEDWPFALDEDEFSLPVGATAEPTRMGPPIPGAPWARRLWPAQRATALAVPPQVVNTADSYVPRVIDGPPVPGAPWARRLPGVPPLSVTPAQTRELPPVPQVYAAPVRVGPPVPGAPWVRYSPSPPPPGFSAPVADVPAAQVYESYRPVIGPPIPGAPWRAQAVLLLGSGSIPIIPVPPPPAPPPPGPPTGGPHRGGNKPFVERVPRPDAPDAQNRMRRHTEKVSQIFNSLMEQGQLVQTSPQSWGITTPFVSDRDPGATDDADSGALMGSWWLNSTAETVWMCTNNSIGSARWKQLG